MKTKARLLLLTLAFLLAACAPSLVVNSAGDEPDKDINDGKCETVNLECTLRAAIQEANHGGNGAFITFENVTTISPATPLPALTGGAIKIRGEGAVTLDGGQELCSSGFTGLQILGSDLNEIQGLTIINFSAGIEINGQISDAKSNVIGPVPNSPADPAKRNVIGGNCAGVYITGSGASANAVVGNYIGTNADGTTANPNHSGIDLINGAHDNLIGSTTAGQVSPFIDTTNMAAYWKMDELSGNAADELGSSTLINNNALLFAPGNINNGADLERSSNQFFELVDNAIMSTGDIDFTAAGWVKLESKPGIMSIFCKYEATANAEYCLYYSNSIDRFQWSVYNTTGTGIGTATANNLGSPALSTWYYIVVWHDSVNNQVGIQVNNGAANTAATNGVPADKTANLRIGADSASEADFLDGIVDEWGWWKRVLTPAEKTDLYAGGAGLSYNDVVQLGNVISGNDGAGIYLANASDNHITGNYIGTKKDGLTPLGNGSGGIYMTNGANSNMIGLDTTGIGAANVISANDYSGILIQQSNNNFVAGNYVGTDVTGSIDLGNESDGIAITEGATGNTIGTNGDGVADDKERNLISGNGNQFTRSGIVLASQNNVVAGNYIGTNSDASAGIGNNGAGIQISGNSNRIGTDSDGVSDLLEANVISGNHTDGIFIGAAFNQVSGNFIGTNATGLSALGNSFDGIRISAAGHDNLIGTNGDGVADAGERNIISANAVFFNGSAGIGIAGYDNVVAGNYIGPDAAGTASLGNMQYGVSIYPASATGNRIGTNGDGVADAAEGNVISGNGWMGVAINAASNNWIAGNLIGTNAAGTAAMPNMHAFASTYGAVNIIGGAHNNVIGTNGDGVADAAERNVISGNAHRGIHMDGQGTTNNVVAGNYIGTNAAGTAALGNQLGVEISSDANGNRIGTDGNGVADAAERNVISANGGGIVIIVASSNQIAGNFIGTDKNGTAPLGNGNNGISIEGSNTGATNGNVIGGTLIKANVIAFNQGDGIESSGFAVNPINNPILYNSIFSNTSLGINLNPGNQFYNITPNDVGDGDSGANNLMNFPELDSALSIDNMSITIVGEMVDGLANTSFLIQFFSSPACDNPSEHGEGQTFLGEITEMTDGSGDVSFLASFAVSVQVGHVITATATAANNTSEFSECVTVVAGQTLQGESQFTPPPSKLKIVPLRNLNCRSYCTSQADIADTLLQGVEYYPIGWDPVTGYFAFLGPTFGEMCFAPPEAQGTELMALELDGEPVSTDLLTADIIEILSCPVFSTPTPTPDVDEGENATPTPLPQCSDGIDNDGDGRTDYSATGAGDPQCRNANDNDELNP